MGRGRRGDPGELLFLVESGGDQTADHEARSQHRTDVQEVDMEGLDGAGLESRGGA